MLTSKIGKCPPCFDALNQAAGIGISKWPKISAGIPTPYTPYCFATGYAFTARSLSSRLVILNLSGKTTVSDISENDTSLPRVHWSVLVLCNLPGRLEPWDPSIWRGYFGELKGLDLLKLGAEPDVLGGLTDTGGLNSLIKFCHVMVDFG